MHKSIFVAFTLLLAAAPAAFAHPDFSNGNGQGAMHSAANNGNGNGNAFGAGGGNGASNAVNVLTSVMNAGGGAGNMSATGSANAASAAMQAVTSVMSGMPSAAPALSGLNLTSVMPTAVATTPVTTTATSVAQMMTPVTNMTAPVTSAVFSAVGAAVNLPSAVQTIQSIVNLPQNLSVTTGLTNSVIDAVTPATNSVPAFVTNPFTGARVLDGTDQKSDPTILSTDQTGVNRPFAQPAPAPAPMLPVQRGTADGAIVQPMNIAILTEGKPQAGWSLFAPNETTTLDTPFGAITVPARAAVLIRITENGLAVYNMCNGRDEVSISVGATELELAAGHEVRIQKAGGRERAQIAIRAAHEVKINDALTAQVGEFSIPNALAKDSLYQRLAKGDSAQRDLLNRIMKSAVSVHTVTISHGNYTR